MVRIPRGITWAETAYIFFATNLKWVAWNIPHVETAKCAVVREK